MRILSQNDFLPSFRNLSIMTCMILRACLESLLKSKIFGQIRSKYTCAYRSFSLCFSFSPRDSRQALRSLQNRIGRAVSFCFFFACVTLITTNSLAQTPKSSVQNLIIQGEVIMLHATNEGKGIDSTIGKLPELSKPPFSSYNTYKLIGKSPLSLSVGKKTSTKLPNSRTMSITLKDIVAPKQQSSNSSKPPSTAKYLVTASIQETNGKDFLPLLEVSATPGNVFFLAGQNYNSGSLVIGIRLNP